MSPNIENINIFLLVEAYNKNLTTFTYKGIDPFGMSIYKTEKTPKNKKIKIHLSDSIIEMKIKEITQFLAKKRTNLKNVSTRHLLNSFQGYRFYYQGEEYKLFYLKNGFTCLRAIKKELDKREHIPTGKDAKKLRQFMAQKKVSKKEAIKLMYGGK